MLFGYGLAQKKAAPLLIASLAPVGIAFVLMLVLSNGLPVVYVAVRSEERLLPREATVARTFVMTKYPHVYAWINPAQAMEPNERDRMLANPPMRSMRGSKTLVLALVSGSIGQLALFVVALIWFDYSFM